MAIKFPPKLRLISSNPDPKPLETVKFEGEDAVERWAEWFCAPDAADNPKRFSVRIPDSWRKKKPEGDPES